GAVPTRAASRVKLVALAVAWLAALPAVWPLDAHAAETLIFSPLPLAAPETVAAQWKPVLGHIEKSLGVTVRIEYSADYGEILDKFRAGKIDLAQLGPLPYVVLRQAFSQVEPLVHFNESDGQPTYTCALVAPAEAKLAPQAIKGKKIALTQPLSTCGYFVADILLRQAGGALEGNRYRYLGRHDAVALAVIGGEFDAGVMRTTIAREHVGLGLAVIAESLSLPGSALVANAATVKAGQRVLIQQALQDADAATRARWGVYSYGVTPARDGDYAAVRRLRGGVGRAPAQGNY
ncbi:MAG: PhnD/SsuA/transferrin family substrate-binding protein, partial [Rhodocyclaceae bacterium]|nr:PhnD/SsuA/transferrin family substrate-binding protein [Rhodocyclaceae bacterium]